jgi:hypothetical protein
MSRCRRVDAKAVPATKAHYVDRLAVVVGPVGPVVAVAVAAATPTASAATTQPVACDGGASANTPAPNRAASPLAISVLIFAASFSWRLLCHQFDNRGSGSSATSSSASSATMPHECKAGQCRGDSRAWPCEGLAVLLLANSQTSVFRSI